VKAAKGFAILLDGARIRSERLISPDRAKRSRGIGDRPWPPDGLNFFYGRSKKGRVFGG